MSELLTAAQMRAIEAAAIASGEVTGLELMERAGRGVVEAIFEEWPELRAGSFRAVVLCGPGNNGGDGFVVARVLKEWGWEVAVRLYGDPARLPPDAKTTHDRWCEIGAVDHFFDRRVDYVFQADVLIDALFGTGLERPVQGLPGVFDSIHEAQINLFAGPRSAGVDRVVSVDIASGRSADSGRWLGPPDEAELQPDLTVTFHQPKVGHYLGEPACGTLTVASIGLLGRMPESCVHLVGRRSQDRLNKWGDHKYTHGHALILSGGAGRGGAARLAARGALRIGAGLVTLGCPPEALTENAARLDAVMLREISGPDALNAMLSDRRITAAALGPGLGTGDEAADLVAAALAWQLPEDPARPLIDATDAQAERHLERHGHRPACVLDADALTILAREPGLFAALHPACVLTPHAGEFARLFPDIAEKLAAPATKGPAYSKVDATREAAKRAGCVVLYKGPDTVIADPSGRCSINSAHYDRAAPWLATAGSGDVLAGFIAGLLARGFMPMQAAETAAWLHVECARKFGPGLIAEDLPEQLPAVFRDLGL